MSVLMLGKMLFGEWLRTAVIVTVHHTCHFEYDKMTVDNTV